MASGLFNCYESAADVRSTIERHVALETKAGLQLLLLPHSLFPCVHGMLRCRSREEERMMYSCLEKGLGPSLLEERLIEHSCSVKNGLLSEREAKSRVIEKKPPKAAINLGTDVDAPWGEKIETSRKDNHQIA